MKQEEEEVKSYTIKWKGVDRYGCGFSDEETFRETEDNAYNRFWERVTQADETETEFWLIRGRSSVIGHAKP